MPRVPDELKAASWEKDKKSGFDAKSDVAEKLKLVQKKHNAVDWTLFAPGWAKGARTAAELEAAIARRDKVYQASVLPLKKEAQAVAGLARAAEKKADKALLATLKSIGKAADAYAGAVDECAEALREAGRKAQDALPEEDDEDSVPSALINPKLLFKQLTLCRKDAERSMKFAFVDARDKQPAMLAMHPRMGARALFTKLQAAAGVKTGAYGTAWVDGMSLMLQLDKPLSGLVKKIRPPVKACGFRISKVVLWNADGSVFEQDEQPEDGSAEPQAAGPSATPQPAAGYEAKLAALMPRVKQAAGEGSADAVKHQRLLEFAAAKAESQDFAVALAALTQLEQLLDKAAPRAEAPGLDAGVAFKARLTALLGTLKEAIAAGGPAAVEVKLKASEAGVMASKKDFGQANRLLDEIEQLLQARESGAPVGVSPGESSAASPGAAQPRATGAFVAFTQTRLIWDNARNTIQQEMRNLERSILDQCADHPELAQIAEGTKGLYKRLEFLDKRLIDKLDEALNAKTAEARDALHQQAREIVQAYTDYVQGEPLFSDIDDNGFAPVTIASTLKSSLADMARQLRGAVAA